MGGIAFLTLAINGTTSGFLLKALGMLKPEMSKSVTFSYLKDRVHKESVAALKAWQEDPDEPEFSAEFVNEHCQVQSVCLEDLLT